MDYEVFKEEYKKECRGIPDRLYALGIEPLSVAHFTSPVTDSVYKHYISLCIELRKGYPVSILGDLYTGWKFYTETITDDKLPLLVLGYTETFVYEGGQSVEERVIEIIKQFENYLGTFEPQSVRAILMLMDS